MKIKSLDCTLRDGGYVNQWEFSNKQIIKVIDSLCQSGVEIIETGFIDSNVSNSKDSTVFGSIEDISSLLTSNLSGELIGSRSFVVMVNFGSYDFDLLPPRSEVAVDGIRVAFHKRDRKEIIHAAEKIINKGYKFFLQPMVTAKYSDTEILDLLSDFSDLDVYSYYIVDSYGSMYPHELVRLFYLISNNIPESVSIGFHSHNNLQLAFANTIELLKVFSSSKRTVIIDSSMFGMGR